MTIGVIILDCAGLVEPDAATVARIARLQLDARRSGAELRLDNANECLLDLIDFCGLARVLGEVKRQAE